MDFPAHHPILFRSRWVATGLDRDTAAVNLPALCQEYESLRANAPSRSQRGKAYFVGHDGIPSASDHTSRREEHAAIALCNLQRHWQHPRGTGFRFLDYQFPLKARQADKGIGKIDLIGVDDEQRLLITELKLAGADNGRGDAPTAALMEGLRYAAIVEANLPAIAAEARGRFGVSLRQTRPAIQLLAPLQYWRGWWNCLAAGDWQRALTDLIANIEEKLGISVDCLALDDFQVICGLDGDKPRLDPLPDLHSVPLPR